MASPQFARKNHSVPEAYLKAWAGEDSRVQSYRLLVPHERYPEWEGRYPGRLTRYTDLYTSSYSGIDSDRFERWINKEIEDPAAAALTKVRADQRLDATDWSKLAMYGAALDLRTPAAYFELSDRWEKTVPETLRETMADLPRRLEEAARSGELARSTRRDPAVEGYPMKVSVVELGEGQKGIRAEIVMGREMWLSEQHRMLTTTAQVWTSHHWTILKPHPGSQWFTTDHPVVKLNYYADGTYDLKGGWNRAGGVLMVPLSPQHLMYTHIGSAWEGPTTLPIDFTAMLQRFVAERAFRWIFARGQPLRATWYRPRRVDLKQFCSEEEIWKSWDARHRAAETGPARELGAAKIPEGEG